MQLQEIVEYQYVGVGMLAGTDLPETGTMRSRYHDPVTTGSYPGFDRFGRVILSKWYKGGRS